jgi:hypothetical protein
MSVMVLASNGAGASGGDGADRGAVIASAVTAAVVIGRGRIGAARDAVRKGKQWYDRNKDRFGGDLRRGFNNALDQIRDAVGDQWVRDGVSLSDWGTILGFNPKMGEDP